MIEFQSLTVLEQFQSLYSDMYKDAHGFRPRINPSWTLADYESEFEYLQDCIRHEEDERLMREEENAEAFERRLQELYLCGAKDREMAIRWIHEAEDTDGDDERLCHVLGLSYDYFKA